jgi:malonate transporter and related proteins
LIVLGLYFVALLGGMLALRLTPSAAALFALGATFPAVPFFGPAVLGGLFGPRSAVAIASTAIIGNLLLVPITLVVLEAARRTQQVQVSAKASPVAVDATGRPGEAIGKPEGGSGNTGLGVVIRQGVLNAAKQPYVLAPIVGLVLVLTGIRVPSLVTSMLNLIGQTTSGVSLFVAGLLAAAYSLKLNGATAINVALKSLVQPALMLAFARLVGLSSPLASEAVVAMALPSAVITPMLAARFGTYQAETGSTMLLSTVLMMVVVPCRCS